MYIIASYQLFTFARRTQCKYQVCEADVSSVDPSSERSGGLRFMYVYKHEESWDGDLVIISGADMERKINENE